ncbi:cytochrome B, partial [Rhodospirillaceae bacterium RKSG073]|nr:cytochrome B [Curvivirga aplysinae]
MMFKKVWDIPTRLFHWLLVLLIAAAYVTAEFELGDLDMTYHMYVGYSILAFVIYRILWGILGSSSARFSDFIKSPKAVFSYIKSMYSSQPQKYLGHNPAGGLMVLALLTLILMQAIFGLFTTDDILVDGPLVHIASSSFVSFASSWHHTIFDILLIFIGI